MVDAPPARTRRVAPFIALGVALVIGVLVVVLATSKRATVDESAATPLLGKAAPPISGPTLDGSTFDLAKERGNWVVLNFFQSTCVPCEQEHPELVQFAQQQSALAAGAHLVSVVFSDDDRRVADFFARRGGSWPVVLDRGGEVPFAYGVAQVPETWILDPAGRVVVHYITKVTASGLSAKLQELRDAAGSGN